MSNYVRNFFFSFCFLLILFFLSSIWVTEKGEEKKKEKEKKRRKNEKENFLNGSYLSIKMMSRHVCVACHISTTYRILKGL
jgi:hypothetical protein